MSNSTAEYRIKSAPPRLAYWRTGIATLDELLTGRPEEESNLVDYKQQLAPSGIAHLDGNGFFGVVFGKAGSGKSILGLQTCCEFVRQTKSRKNQIGGPYKATDMDGRRPGRPGSSRPQPRPLARSRSSGRPRPLPRPGARLSRSVWLKPLVQTGGRYRRSSLIKPLHTQPSPSANWAIYVSVEPFELLKAKLEDLNFFRPGEAPCAVSELGNLQNGPDQPDAQPTLCLVRMPLDTPGQVRLLSNVLSTIQHWTESGTNLNQRIFLCVDNAEGIDHSAMLHAFDPEGGQAPDTLGFSKEGRPVKNFYKLIRQRCIEQKLYTFFIFEEPSPNGNDVYKHSVALTDQAYAADIAIHLTQHSFPNGYSERRLEILKAKNQYYRRGQHHFSIVGPKSDSGTRAGVNYGIVIYESLATQLHKQGRYDWKDKGKRPETEFRLGIDSLDQMIWESLKADHASSSDTNTTASGQGVRYWNRASISEGAGSGGFLKPGSVSVLVADLDSTATEIGLHFALQRDSGSAIFISFAHDRTTLLAVAGRFGKRFSNEAEQIMVFGPEHISEGKLLHDIGKQIDKCTNKDKVVVVDNLYALAAKFPLITHEQHFITALFNLFRTRGVCALVVEVVEVGENRNPLERSFAAALAENAFLLRHVEFQSRSRKVFTVLKLMEARTPDRVWALDQRPSQTDEGQVELIAEDSFRFYKNVLQGQPMQVQITMSLHGDADDSPLSRFLTFQQSALAQIYGQNLRILKFHRGEYRRYDEIIYGAKTQPTGDCHIISIDEIWLMDLIKHDRLESFRSDSYGSGNPGGLLSAWQDYVTVAHDMAIDRCGKTFKSSVWFAVPDRNNCGVLCFNDPGEWAGNLPVGTLGECIAEIVADLRSSVRQQSVRHNLTWGRLAEAQDMLAQVDGGGVAGLNVPAATQSARKKVDGNPGEDMERLVLFTFCMDTVESYVAMLLEVTLSLAYPFQETDGQMSVGNPWIIDGEGLLETGSDPIRNPVEQIWVAGLCLFLRLLSAEDLLILSRGHLRPSRMEPMSLISRQWFSTWGTIQERNRRRAVGETVGKDGVRVMVDGCQYSLEAGEIKKDFDDYANMHVFELPSGIPKGRAASVSGAWYLGIVKGGSCVSAGQEVINCFTSETEDAYKWEHGIGLPVRSSFYTEAGCDDQNPLKPLLYAREFIRIHQQLQKDREPVGGRLRAGIYKSICPFYRTSIYHYRAVSQELWRLMVSAALLTVGRSGWRAEAKDGTGTLEAGLLRLVKGFLGRARSAQRIAFYEEENRKAHERKATKC